MKLKHKSLVHGVTMVTTAVLALSVTAGIVLEAYSTQVDEALGTQSYQLTSEDSDDLYQNFTPPEEVLNSDGTTDTAKLMKYYFNQSVALTEEGSVLLKNENNALPLAKGSNITLLGVRSYKTCMGMSGGASVSGPVIPLNEALSDRNETNLQVAENNTDGKTNTYPNWSYEGGGFNINPTVESAYKKLYSSYKYTMKPSDTGDDVTISQLGNEESNFTGSFASYNDAAIVTISRGSTEGGEYTVTKDDDGNILYDEQPLGLTDNEREIISTAKQNFNKVIVLINSANTMEIEELANDDEIDAILWIGFPGNYGTVGIAHILNGTVSPSGAMSDTYVASNLSAPAMMNQGDFTYGNKDDVTMTNNGSLLQHYVIEAESIYTGYYYYETRYYDSVLGQGNASSSAGVVRSSGNNWNYNDEVTYAFGYGLSYTTFKQEIVGKPTVTQSAHELTMDFEVKVTNTGSVAGKSIVSIYGQSPYTQYDKDNAIEKSAVQLLAYEKTGTLAAGESETVTVHVDWQNIASYDSSYDNGDGTYGTYILEEGDYYFALGNGAHEAVNNILAKQGKSKTDGMDAEGDEDVVYKYTYEYAGTGTVDGNTFGVSKAGVKVSNQLETADWNSYDVSEKVTYLSRSDWQGTYPKAYMNLIAPADMLEDLNGHYYTIAKVKTEDVTFDSTETDWKFYQLALTDYDDYRWDEMISQMSIEECMTVHAAGGPVFQAIESIGFEENTLAENDGTGIKTLGSFDKDGNAPWAVKEGDSYYGISQRIFACAEVVASTFNDDVVHDYGEALGVMSLYTGVSILWGPGLNTHRTAYNGRQGEYYSEDPILSGTSCMEAAMGALDYGLVVGPKHFAFNDQETNRVGVAPFMTEQKAREVELRAWQIAIEADKYDRLTGEDKGMLGLMTSYSKLGAVECASNYGLLTGILQNEWNFHGYATSDLNDDFNGYTATLYAGLGTYDVRFGYKGYDQMGTGMGHFYESMYDGVQVDASLYTNDSLLQNNLKKLSKNIMWTLAQSNLTNRYNSTTRRVELTTWWRALYKTLIGVTAVLTVAGVGATVVFEFIGKDKKKKEEA